jgi:hypothetical protein
MLCVFQRNVLAVIVPAELATLAADRQKAILYAANKHVERPHLHLKRDTCAPHPLQRALLVCWSVRPAFVNVDSRVIPWKGLGRKQTSIWCQNLTAHVFLTFRM